MLIDGCNSLCAHTCIGAAPRHGTPGSEPAGVVKQQRRGALLVAAARGEHRLALRAREAQPHQPLHLGRRAVPGSRRGPPRLLPRRSAAAAVAAAAAACGRLRRGRWLRAGAAAGPRRGRGCGPSGGGGCSGRRRAQAGRGRGRSALREPCARGRTRQQTPAPPTHSLLRPHPRTTASDACEWPPRCATATHAVTRMQGRGPLGPGERAAAGPAPRPAPRARGRRHARRRGRSKARLCRARRPPRRAARWPAARAPPGRAAPPAARCQSAARRRAGRARTGTAAACPARAGTPWRRSPAP